MQHNGVKAVEILGYIYVCIISCGHASDIIQMGIPKFAGSCDHSICIHVFLISQNQYALIYKFIPHSVHA